MFEAELHGLLLAMEFATSKGRHHIWLESDSTSAVQVFKNHDIVPFRLRNRWFNCFHFGLQEISSHIYREGNCCAGKLANHAHNITDDIWFATMPHFFECGFLLGPQWTA